MFIVLAEQFALCCYIHKKRYAWNPHPETHTGVRPCAAFACMQVPLDGWHVWDVNEMLDFMYLVYWSLLDQLFYGTDFFVLGFSLIYFV
jgi:hypothetical protein